LRNDDIPFPGEVEVELFNIEEDDEYQEFLDIVWLDESDPEYEPEEAGTYTFEGELTDLPDNVTNEIAISYGRINMKLNSLAGKPARELDKPYVFVLYIIA